MILIIFLFFQISFAEYYWIEQNNVIKYVDISSPENYRTYWDYTGGTYTNNGYTFIYDHYTFKSTCCQQEYKYFDGITNIDPNQLCDSCSQQYGERYFIFSYNMSGTYSMKHLLLQTAEERMKYIFNGDNFPDGLAIHFYCDASNKGKCRTEVNDNVRPAIETTKSFSFFSDINNYLCLRFKKTSLDSNQPFRYIDGDVDQTVHFVIYADYYSSLSSSQ